MPVGRYTVNMMHIACVMLCLVQTLTANPLMAVVVPLGMDAVEVFDMRMKFIQYITFEDSDANLLSSIDIDNKTDSLLYSKANTIYRRDIMKQSNSTVFIRVSGRIESVAVDSNVGAIIWRLAGGVVEGCLIKNIKHRKRAVQGIYCEDHHCSMALDAHAGFLFLASGESIVRINVMTVTHLDRFTFVQSQNKINHLALDAAKKTLVYSEFDGAHSYISWCSYGERQVNVTRGVTVPGMAQVGVFGDLVYFTESSSRNMMGLNITQYPSAEPFLVYQGDVRIFKLYQRQDTKINPFESSDVS